MIDTISFVISVLEFFYWPLLYVRLKDLQRPYKLTKKKVMLALLFALVAAFYLNTYFSIFAYLALPYVFIMLPAMPILLLAVLPKVSKGNKIKIIVLAAYAHAAWKLIPRIDINFIISELFFIVVIVSIVRPMRIKYKRHERTISKIWE